MPDLTDTAANADGAFVFQTDDTTPQQVVNALEDFTTWLDLFTVRSREYGDGAAFELGSKGQFSDIYRKIIKLRTAIWDGKPEQLTSEGTEEVVYDLIGHLFLTLQCLRLEAKESSPITLRGFAEKLMETPEYQRLAGIDREAEAIRKIKEEEYKQMLEVKRQRVLELYPQISKGSLDARTEESLDWLISAAKPEPATDLDGEDPFPNRGREWLYGRGDKVRNVGSPGSWLEGEVGTIIKRRYEDGGTWYAVDFSPKAGEITCSQGSLEIVSRSQAWWDKHKEETDEVPDWQKGVEIQPRKSVLEQIQEFPKGRPIKDNPQA